MRWLFACASVFGSAAAVDAQMPATESSGSIESTASMPGEMEMNMGAMQGGSPPPDARDPHAYANGVDFTRGTARPRFTDLERFGSILLDNFELTRVDGETSVPYDLEAWFGSTYMRAVLKAEGEIESGDLAEARTELLFSRAISAYWDAQIGIRHDRGAGPGRTWLAAGIEGLAPYWFDLEVTAYIGESSRSALRIDAAYEMRLTQRLVLEPRLETSFYGESDPAKGRGSGWSESTVGLRLRYEIRRELAPYIGIERTETHGRTEELARAAGYDPSDSRFVLGLRYWY